MIDPTHPSPDDQIDIEDTGAQAQDEAKPGVPPRPQVGDEITQAEIWAWCDWFAAQGVEEASARAIRKERGGKGSPAGIHAHVLTWRADRDKAQNKAQQQAKPKEKAEGASTATRVAVLSDLPNTAAAMKALAEAIMTDATAAVQAVQDEAARDQKAIRADCDRQIAEMRAGNEATIASLNADHAKALEVMQTDLDGALADAQEEQARADGLDKAINGPDGYVAQIAARDQRIEALEKEIERLRPLEARVAELGISNADLVERLEAEEQKRQSAEAREAEARADAEKQRGIADVLRDRLDTANAAAAEATTRAANAEGKAGGLETALASAERLAEDREKEVARLDADLKRVRAERDALRQPAQAEQPTEPAGKAKPRRGRGAAAPAPAE